MEKSGIKKIGSVKVKIDISKILNNKIHEQTPISAQYIGAPKVENKMLIKPLRNFDDLSEKEKVNVEKWLHFCTIGNSILNTSTKALTNMKVISERNAIHDLLRAFGSLGNHYFGNDYFEQKNRDIDSFLFTFIGMSEENQNRVIKFQESILNKQSR